MHLFKCSVCGKIQIFDNRAGNHTRYTSAAIDETAPRLAVYTCSHACLKTAEQKIDSGEWALPTLRNKGYYFNVSKPQKGYKAQPDQLTLKNLFNRQQAV